MSRAQLGAPIDENVVEDPSQLPESNPPGLPDSYDPQASDSSALPQRVMPQPPPQPPPAQVNADGSSMPVQSPAQPFLAGGAKPGALSETPRQASADYQNLSHRQQDLYRQGGNNDLETGQLLSSIYDKDAKEKHDQSQDYKLAFDASNKRQQEAADRTVAIYKDLRSKAGSLKDPANQYFADNGGTVSRVISGLAAFASGFGQGMLGKGGNPYLDYLNKQIENNFNSHKKNIDDLYNTEVAAGSMEDNALNRSKWEQQARLTHYQLSSQEIIPMLESVKATATGRNQQLMAEEGINGLLQNDIGTRQQLAHSDAAADANARQQQRADMIAARGALKDAEALFPPEKFGPDERANGIAKYMAGQGFPLSNPVVGASMEANGQKWDGKKFVPINPTGQPGTTGEQDDVPLADPRTGRLYTPEEQDKIRSRKTNYGGQVRWAHDAPGAKEVQAVGSANDGLERKVNRMEQIEAERQALGELTSRDAVAKARALAGEFDGLRAGLTVEYNRAMSGTNRATAQGEAVVLGEEAIPKSPPVLGLRDWITGRQSENLGKFKALKSVIKDNRGYVEGLLEPATKQRTNTNAPAIRFTPVK